MAWQQDKSMMKSPQSDDIQVTNSPSDGIASLSLNGNITSPSTMLIAGAWDNTVSCYVLQYDNQNKLVQANAQAQIRHDAPVLCTDIASDGVTVFSGGCDNTIRMWNPSAQGSSPQTIGQHDQPVRSLKFLAEHNVVVSSSWDKYIKVWDARQPNPVAVMQLSERAHCMDARNTALVVGTADRKLNVFELAGGGYRSVCSYDSPLNYQTRSIAIFHTGDGFVVGCIEGRIAVEYFSELSKKSGNVSV